MRAPKPIHQFRIYPLQRGRLFFVVKVFKTKTAMWSHGKNSGLASPPYNYGAICIGYSNWFVYPKKSNKRPELTPRLGEIHFNCGQLDSETLSHECTHAMFRWMRRKNISVEDRDPNQGPRPNHTSRKSEAGKVLDTEERCCMVLGQMVRQTVNGLYRAGLIQG